MSFKTYPKIFQIGHYENKEIFSNPDDLIYIEEKIDGANFRFMISEDGRIIFGSRTQSIGDSNNDIGGNWKRCVDYIKNKLSKKDLSQFKHLVFFGECLSGDTVIRKVSGGRGDNGNYMTIKEMYNYLHKNEKGRNTSWWKRYGMPSIWCLNHKTGKIEPNKIKTILYSGKKQVYEITTRLGYQIKATNNHPFLTPNGYVKLESLKEKDVLAISNLTKLPKKRNLGKGSRKILFKQKLYKNKVGRCEKCDEKNNLELHHKDRNPKNNSENNWEILCVSCHKKLNEKYDGIRIYDYFYDDIVSIKLIGKEDVYDISMEGNENTANFVANNFIVHNCCIKHTLNYDWEKIPPFLGFDIFTLQEDKFLDYDLRTKIFSDLGLLTVPLITIKKVSEITEINDDMVPQSIYTSLSSKDLKAEGIVFKNYNKQIFCKIVTDAFKEQNAEVFGGRPKIGGETDEAELVFKYCTNPRIDKHIFKLIDDGNKLEMALMKLLPSLIEKDIYEENWQEIIRSNWTINFKKTRKLITKRCLNVLNQFITNQALNNNG